MSRILSIAGLFVMAVSTLALAEDAPRRVSCNPKLPLKPDRDTIHADGSLLLDHHGRRRRRPTRPTLQTGTITLRAASEKLASAQASMRTAD